MSHLGERLSALIDGELGHAERDRVLTHLAGCEPCRREAVALRLLKRRMRTLGEATAGAALTDRLMALAGATARPAGPRPRTLPGQRPQPGDSLPRWPVRSLALTALVLLALGLPAAAFLAGGNQREPGPSVTPAVDMFITQHAITNGSVPASGTATGPAPSRAATPPPAILSGSRVGSRPPARTLTRTPPRSVTRTPPRSVTRHRAGAAARPRSRHDSSAPRALRTSRAAAGQQAAGPGDG